jgi:hypothetical protein
MRTPRISPIIIARRIPTMTIPPNMVIDNKIYCINRQKRTSIPDVRLRNKAIAILTIAIRLIIK